MITVTGTVEIISAKPRGNGTAYGIKMSDGQWYGHGFVPPKFQKGDNVTFVHDGGQYKNIDVRSVQVTGGGVPQAAPQQAPAPQQGGGRPNNTQVAIQYQASRNSAIALLEVMLQNAAVALPTKKSDQYDAILALVDDLTNQFHVKTDKVVENGGIVLEELEQAIVHGDDF